MKTDKKIIKFLNFFAFDFNLFPPYCRFGPLLTLISKMRTSPFKSWSNEKLKKNSIVETKSSKRNYAVLRSMRGLNNTGKVNKFSKNSSMKKKKLKIAKVSKKTRSFIGQRDSPTNARIGRMTKNFIRDEYIYKGRKVPKGESPRKVIQSSKKISRAIRKLVTLSNHPYREAKKHRLSDEKEPKIEVQ